MNTIIGTDGKIDLTKFNPDKLTSLELLVLAGLGMLPSNLSQLFIGGPMAPNPAGLSPAALTNKLLSTLPAAAAVTKWAATPPEHMPLDQFLHIVGQNIDGIYHMNYHLQNGYGSCNLTGDQVMKLIAAAHEIRNGRL